MKIKPKKLSTTSSLKTRFMLVFAFFSVLLALFYTFVSVGISLGTEDEIYNRQLSIELEHQTSFYNKYWRFDKLPRDMEIYKGNEIQSHPLYPMIAQLEENIDELEEQNFHIAKSSVEGGKVPFYILYDIGNQEIDAVRTEEFTKIGLTAFFIVAATGILVGAWLGVRTSRPIIQLDERVQMLENNGEFGETESFGGDEVGRLAHSFAASYDRIQQFLSREERFTREVSHELRTPVAVIKGALDILEVQPDNPRALDRIRRAGNEMEQLIETFLLLGREDNLTLSEETLDIEAVCHLLIEEHQKNTSVPIQLNIVEDPQLHVLPPVFGVLLGNLLGNAVRHTAQGQIAINLTREALVVEDSGEGFPPAVLEAIGQPYVNGSSGYGLGLSIVQRISQQFNWKLSIDSDATRGSQVTIRFDRP